MHASRFLLLIIIPLIAAGFSWMANQPQNVGLDAPGGKLKSVSFAPFREGYNPLEKKFPRIEHIDEDLRLIADKTESVRTYANSEGMEHVPRLARKYGLTVTQGAWLRKTSGDNEVEIQALINTANAYADVVKRVIVGNEVLLRQELTPDQLIEYIRTVKRSIKQPVSYADAWSAYLKYPQLIEEVDFITIHVLPYWEDEPISVEVGLEHVKKIVQQVHEAAEKIAPGKPILVGETGWPGAGRQRGMAIPSVVNQARFVRSLMEISKDNGFDYNVVEAFNQPWKSKLEGVVGANWGVMSVAREALFPLAGLVYENPHWQAHLLISEGLWLSVIAILWHRLRGLPFKRFVLILGVSQVLALSFVSMAVELWQTSYDDWQRAYSLAVVLATAGFCGLLLWRIQSVLNERQPPQKLGQYLWLGYVFFAGLAAYKTLELAMIGRYISFPVSQLTVPAVGILGLLAAQALVARSRDGRQFRLNALFGDNMPNTWELMLILLLLVVIAYNVTQRVYETPRVVGSLFILLGLSLLIATRRGNVRKWAILLGIGLLGLVIGETYAYMVLGDFIMAHPNWRDGLPTALNYTLTNQQLIAWILEVTAFSLPLFYSYREEYQDQILTPIRQQQSDLATSEIPVLSEVE
jgi:exo-beta-1,3-glucanase (GH17 family)